MCASQKKLSMAAQTSCNLWVCKLLLQIKVKSIMLSGATSESRQKFQ